MIGPHVHGGKARQDGDDPRAHRGKDGLTSWEKLGLENISDEIEATTC